jgi:hypothetical protein
MLLQLKASTSMSGFQHQAKSAFAKKASWLKSLKKTFIPEWINKQLHRVIFVIVLISLREK